jgi:hypothetical protein
VFIDVHWVLYNVRPPPCPQVVLFLVWLVILTSIVALVVVVIIQATNVRFGGGGGGGTGTGQGAALPVVTLLNSFPVPVLTDPQLLFHSRRCAQCWSARLA